MSKPVATDAVGGLGPGDVVEGTNGRETRPPASINNVAPRGSLMNAESPCPTSKNVTCSRPSPREVTSVHGCTSIQMAVPTAAAIETTDRVVQHTTSAA